MMLPGVIAVSMPPLVGFLLGAKALGGMLAGGLLGCVLLALMMANAGGAWDNAKKYIEKGNRGGKGSDTHAAAVVGDTVGDPFKDTSGPSMNILIKLTCLIGLVVAPILGEHDSNIEESPNKVIILEEAGKADLMDKDVNIIVIGSDEEN